MALQQYALLLHSFQSQNNELGYSSTNISALSLTQKCNIYVDFSFGFLSRFGFARGSIEGCSWLVVQQEGEFCTYLHHVQGQVREDISGLQALSGCWRSGSGFQICCFDEEENRNREQSCSQVWTMLKLWKAAAHSCL